MDRVIKRQIDERIKRQTGGVEGRRGPWGGHGEGGGTVWTLDGERRGTERHWEGARVHRDRKTDASEEWDNRHGGLTDGP